MGLACENATIHPVLVELAYLTQDVCILCLHSHLFTAKTQSLARRDIARKKNEKKRITEKLPKAGYEHSTTSKYFAGEEKQKSSKAPKIKLLLRVVPIFNIYFREFQWPSQLTAFSFPFLLIIYILIEEFGTFQFTSQRQPVPYND